MNTKIIEVGNCRAHQEFLLRLVASKVPVEGISVLHGMETPLIWIFSKLADSIDMTHLPCVECPLRAESTEDKGKITIYTIAKKDPAAIVECGSDSCENVQPSALVEYTGKL